MKNRKRIDYATRLRELSSPEFAVCPFPAGVHIDRQLKPYNYGSLQVLDGILRIEDNGAGVLCVDGNACLTREQAAKLRDLINSFLNVPVLSPCCDCGQLSTSASEDCYRGKLG